MLLRAWGRMTSLSLWYGFRDREIAASTCPLGRDWMLPLTISATTDVVNRVRPSILAMKAGVISNPVPSTMSQLPGGSITPKGS